MYSRSRSDSTDARTVPREDGDADYRDSGHHGEQSGTQHGNQDQRQQDGRERVDRVHYGHRHSVYSPTEIASQRAEDQPERRAERH